MIYAVPPNDDFDQATAIAAFPFSQALDTSGATSAVDDPAMGCGEGTNTRTVWYRFTAPSNGFVSINTVGSDFDTVAAAWQGSRGNLVRQGCNDDGGWWSTTTNLNVPVMAGQSYIVELAARPNSGGGQLRLDLSFNTCTYASGDEAAVQAILQYYGLSGIDTYTERITLPNATRCAIVGLAMPGAGLTLPLPPAIGALPNLQTLDLHGNGISGSLPAELGNLRNLRWLALHSNRFSGWLPPNLGSMVKLEALELANNQLSGPLPGELVYLQRLQRLYLSHNQLSGPLPDWLGSLGNLEQGWLGYNQFSGAIPNSLGSLAKLRQLSLAHNQLNGPLPDELGALSRLDSLYLSENQLSGAVPAWLNALPALRILFLDHNQLRGPLPAAWGGLQRLELLHLEGNQLSDVVPASIGDLASLRGLFLDHNQLSGALPASLGNLASLRGLYLDDNPIGGPLPASLGSLSELRRLSVDHTQLSGALPSGLAGLENLWAGDTRATDLCEPADPAFQAWLAGVRYWQGTGEDLRAVADQVVGAAQQPGRRTVDLPSRLAQHDRRRNRQHQLERHAAQRRYLRLCQSAAEQRQRQPGDVDAGHAAGRQQLCRQHRRDRPSRADAAAQPGRSARTARRHDVDRPGPLHHRRPARLRPHADQHGHPNANADGDTHPHPHAYRDAHSIALTHCDLHADRDSHAHSHPHRDGHTHGIADRHADLHADSHMDADANRHGHSNTAASTAVPAVIVALLTQHTSGKARRPQPPATPTALPVRLGKDTTGRDKPVILRGVFFYPIVIFVKHDTMG